MYSINEANRKEHVYPVYGRQFKTTRWYKPIIVSLFFAMIYIAIGVALIIAVMYISQGSTASPMTREQLTSSIFATGYDSMDLANPLQNVVNLGGLALMIPALWLASKIVRDRPFSSYSSARGGWNHRVFWRVFPIGLICVSIPIIVHEVFIEHTYNDFHVRFTLVSFLILTLLGPLQCIAEEYAYRGLLMQTFGTWFRLPVLAVLLQAVLFMLVHPYNTIGKIAILADGIVFALAAWIGRGIEVSSVYHICNNMTIFYLQGLNLAKIESETKMEDLYIDIAMGVVFLVVIYIISKKTDWFNAVKKDDAAAWNGRYDEKLARKEAKANAKAEKLAAKK